MRPRLMRNQQERVIAGVCGGLGDYFAVDPVIVRLVFVLVGFATGIGLLLYPILWVAMPKGPEAPGDLPQLGMADSETVNVNVRQRVASGQAARTGFTFDPHTGERVEQPSTGATQYLDDHTAAAPAQRRTPVLGIILVGIGMMGMASAIGLDAAFVVPLLMIVGGVLLLRKRG
jgi:phage shock protein C